MMNLPYDIYTVLDLIGTFVFALSGAVAAREKGLDIFGIFSIAFIVAGASSATCVLVLFRLPV